MRTQMRIQMQPMARINISVSDELKARMDSAGDDMNWSQVASEAFEAHLDEGGSSQREEVSAEIAQALLQTPAVAVELMGKLLGGTFPQIGRAMTEGVAPMVRRLATKAGEGTPPEAAIDELRATLGAEVILMRLEMLQRREKRRSRRASRHSGGRMEERMQARKSARKRRRGHPDGDSTGSSTDGADDGPQAPVS